MTDFLPTAYIKTNCPFSFKFRLFVTEAGLTDQFQFAVLDPDAASHATDKADLRDRVGHAHSFPIVETAPGEFMSDSDELIEHFGKVFALDPDKLPTLAFYKTGLFPTFLEMFYILAKPLGWIARLGRKPKAFR